MRCYGCSSGCGSADRSSCAASGAIATSEANRKRLLRRKDFHDFSGKMRYSLFYRIRDTTQSSANIRNYLYRLLEEAGKKATVGTIATVVPSTRLRFARD